MNFLLDWAGAEPVGVSVLRSGSIALDKSRMFSVGGPYPLQRFPQQKDPEKHQIQNFENTPRRTM